MTLIQIWLNLNKYTFLLNNECACRISFGDLVLSSQLTLTYQALLVRYDEQNIIILSEVEPIKSGYGLWNPTIYNHQPGRKTKNNRKYATLLINCQYPSWSVCYSPYLWSAQTPASWRGWEIIGRRRPRDQNATSSLKTSLSLIARLLRKM